MEIMCPMASRSPCLVKRGVATTIEATLGKDEERQDVVPILMSLINSEGKKGVVVEQHLVLSMSCYRGCKPWLQMVQALLAAQPCPLPVV